MKTIEERLRAIEEMIAEIHARVVMDSPLDAPGIGDCRRAIEAMVDSHDTTLLAEYIRKGGKPFKAEELYPRADRCGQPGQGPGVLRARLNGSCREKATAVVTARRDGRQPNRWQRVGGTAA